MNDVTIFSLRFGSNAKLEPSYEELQLFLKSEKDGTPGLHRDDLASYWELLTSLAAYKSGGGSRDVRNKILFNVLNHSHFANPALKSAIEQFKYHTHSLAKLDFRKPTAFIKSAEEEIGRLNPGRKEEASRIERMRGMVEERKQILDTLNKQWIELAGELSHIISYIIENMAKIAKLCEKSIAVLVNEQIERKKEAGLIEDIKAQYKERLREALHQGTITKEQLEAAKEEVAELSKRTAELMLSDIYALTQLYEMIHEQSGNTVKELTVITKELERKRDGAHDQCRELYLRAEKVLVALVSACRFEVKVADIGSETGQDRLLSEKRSEMLEHLIKRAQKDA